MEPLIPAPKPGGRPAKVPRREIVNAILYVLKNGIQWLEVVAHPHAGVRGVWVREGEPLPEVERVKGFRPLPKRWVVERTIAWLGRNRRLGKDYEYYPEVTEAWMYLGMIRLLVKRLARAA
nr:transposase [Allomeiothermus silvanus]